MGKGLKDADPKFLVHSKYYKNAQDTLDVILLENVPEYEMERVVAHEMGKSWACQAVVVDPRLFGFGTSRARVYGLCWNKKIIAVDSLFPILKTLEALKARSTMLAQDFYSKKYSGIFRLLTPSEVSRMIQGIVVFKMDAATTKHQKLWLVIPISMVKFFIPPSPRIEASNLADYDALDKDWQVADLTQRVRTGRGRVNPVDGSLMTLTTNSGRLWSKACGGKKTECRKSFNIDTHET